MKNSKVPAKRQTDSRQLPPPLELPADLVAFLSEGKRLEYNPEDCDAGEVTLLSLSELILQRFPVETGGSDFHKQDPHYPKVNSYLVLGVNLVDSCDDYEPVGTLMWLPIEQRYGIWDSSHCKITMFDQEVTWSMIAADPCRYINAQWDHPQSNPNMPKMEQLIPWLAHPYGKKQVYNPQPV